MGSSLKPMVVPPGSDPKFPPCCVFSEPVPGFFSFQNMTARLHGPGIYFANTGPAREGRWEHGRDSAAAGMVGQVSHPTRRSDWISQREGGSEGSQGWRLRDFPSVKCPLASLHVHPCVSELASCLRGLQGSVDPHPIC